MYLLDDYKVVLVDSEIYPMINEEMMREATGLELVNEFVPIRLVGIRDGQEIRTSRIIKIEDGIAYSRSGSEIKLGNMSKHYIDFENAVSNKLPIVQSWRMAQSDDEYLVNGTIFKNGIYREFEDKINGQNEDKTLNVENQGRVFIDWDCFSRSMRIKSTDAFDDIRIDFNSPEEKLKSTLYSVDLSVRKNVEDHLRDFQNNWFYLSDWKVGESFFYIDEQLPMALESIKTVSDDKPKLR